MKIKSFSLCSLGILLLLLNTAGFYLFWGVNRSLVNVFAAAFFLFFYLVEGGRVKSDPSLLLLACFLFLITLWAGLPIREYSNYIFAFPTTLIIPFLLLVPHEKLRPVVAMLAVFTALVSTFALFVFLFALVGIDLPYVRLEQGFRKNPNDYYQLYGLSVVLSTEYFSNFVRTSGFMEEPGHFATFCALLLMANGLDFKERVNKLIAVGGLLTFSPVFYIFIILYWLSEKILILSVEKLTGYLVLGVILFAGMAFAIPDELYYRTVYKYIEYAQQHKISFFSAVMDFRTKGGFPEFYEGLSFGDKLIGLGAGSEYVFGSGVTSSDYRVFVTSYGFVSLISFILFYMVLVLGRSDRNWVLLFLLVVIFSHRSFYLLSPWVLFLAYMAARVRIKPSVEPILNGEEIEKATLCRKHA